MSAFDFSEEDQDAVNSQYAFEKKTKTFDWKQVMSKHAVIFVLSLDDATGLPRLSIRSD